MSNRGPSGGRSGNERNEYGNINFERNKYRQTMPSRFNPISPPDHRNVHRQNSNNSPTQSFVSTVTNYEQPWSSPKIQAPSTPDEPRFRRTHSVAVTKNNGGQKGGQNSEGGKNEEQGPRPKINFKEFGKKFTNKFKKNPNKSMESKKSGDRMSVPAMSLGQSSSASTSSKDSSSLTPSPTKRANMLKAAGSMKMQPEDRMKMFQKMGRQQTMKETSLQRMQRERQRDFSLVPGPGRACIEANPNGSVESMLVFNSTSDSRRSNSLSMTDDDVEPVFKNMLTNKNVTSAQFKNQQKLSSAGPSFTSTPRLMASFQEQSPTISNVRSASEASLCMVANSEPDTNRTDATMYFSADTLNNTNLFAVPNGIPVNSGFCSGPPGFYPCPTMNPAFSGQGFSSNAQIQPPRTDNISLGSTASTPTGGMNQTVSAEKPAVPLKKVKQEIVDTESSCPSITSPTPTSDLESLQNQQQTTNNQPQHLNNLWMVSKEIRDKQIQLEQALPRMDSLRNRAMAIEQQKIILLESKGDNPSREDMVRLWKLDLEFHQLNQQMSITSMQINDSNNLLPYLEMRRNELLANSPPPPPNSSLPAPPIAGSLV